MINITLGNKQYKVREAKTSEDKQKGLQGVKEMPKDEGMIFYFDEPQTVEFWMRDTLLPLDIIFIDEDQEVISVAEGLPNDDTLHSEEDVMYVVELNAKSGVKKGDELEFDEDPDTVMKVLAPDGSTQMELKGGERIVSRRETKVLIRKAKKALDSKNDKDYKTLGRYIFKVFKKQDNRDPEYVDSPNSKSKDDSKTQPTSDN